MGIVDTSKVLRLNWSWKVLPGVCFDRPFLTTKALEWLVQLAVTFKNFDFLIHISSQKKNLNEPIDEMVERPKLKQRGLENF